MSNQEYAPMAGDSRVLYHCLGCGSLVVNIARHDKWHRELAAHSHATLSVIGGPMPSEDASILRSGGQTKQFGPRPRIATTPPNPV